MNIIEKVGIVFMIVGTNIALREEILSYMFVRNNNSPIGAFAILIGGVIFLAASIRLKRTKVNMKVEEAFS